MQKSQIKNYLYSVMTAWSSATKPEDFFGVEFIRYKYDIVKIKNTHFEKGSHCSDD